MILDKIKFNDLLAQLVKQGASDLYLSAGKPPIFKIINELRPANNEILTGDKIEELFSSLISDEQKRILQNKKSLIFGKTFENGLRFKVNLFYQSNFLSADLHFISPVIRSIKELGLPNQVEEIAEIKNGLVVLSGPFNSGKSTTSASIIEYLNNKKQLKIITLEKPIEIIFISKKSIIQQREIGLDTPNLETGLKDCLETNLDIVFVDGFENKKEFELILELSEQGKTVFLITNANSALDTVAKFLSFFNQDEKSRIQNILSRTLKAVLCQKLISSRIIGTRNKSNNFIVVPEILFQTQAVQSSIQDNNIKQLDNIIKTSAKQGMISFEQSLNELVKQGVVAA